jgi:hypothetical protein
MRYNSLRTGVRPRPNRDAPFHIPGAVVAPSAAAGGT